MQRPTNAYHLGVLMLITTLMMTMLLFATPASAQFVRTPGATLRLCYFYFGGIDDLGWTFTFNNGRLRTQAELQRRYPDIKVESIYEPNVFFGVQNKTQNALNYIRRGCHAIITNNEVLFGFGNEQDTWTRQYPNISWILLDVKKVPNTELPQREFVGYDFSAAFFLSGVGAAHTTTNRACFISAYEDSRNPNDAANGFIKGVRSVSATLPIDVVTMNSWYSPNAETRVAELLMDRGCEVVGRYTDPRAVDIAVSKRPGHFSVGPHSNLQEYVGDTVLMSVYVQWDKVLVPQLSSLVTTGRIAPATTRSLLGVGGEYVVSSTISSLAPFAAISAVERARSTTTESTLFCGNVQLRDGRTITGSGPGGCLTLQQKLDNLTSYVADPAVVYHPPFVFESACAPGTFFNYSITGPLTVVCSPCPANTFSEAAGSATCEPCPSGLVSNGNASSCTVPAADSSGLGTTALAVIIAAIVVVVGLIVSFIVYQRMAGAKKNQFAPRSAPLCLLFTDIESSTTLWQNHPDDMQKGLEIHNQVVRAAIERHEAYEVKTVGDAFLIACPTIVDGVLLACDIQTGLQEADWPSAFRYDETSNDMPRKAFQTPAVGINGLKVRIGVHHCRDVTVKHEAFHNYFDYYGNDVNLCARIESQARGGQVLINADSLKDLQADPEYAALQEELFIELFARKVTLKGVVEQHNLFTVLPVSLRGRVFEPLEGHEQDEQLSVSTSHQTSESVSLASEVDRSQFTRFAQAMIEPLRAADQQLLLAKLSTAHGIKSKRHAKDVKRRMQLITAHIESRGELTQVGAPDGHPDCITSADLPSPPEM